jgi:flagellar motility protein MotE (MotC chaperone)
MNSRSWLWILAPLALSAGVLWLSAQESKVPEGLKLSELAERLQNKEKGLTKKEADLQQLEQRLGTLQATLERDRQDLQSREKALQDAIARFEQGRTRPALDPQLTRTYEAMDPVAGAQALKELAHLNQEVAVSLLASMAPKKAGKLMDQLSALDAKLAGKLSERVGLTKDKSKDGA